jgi:transcription termination/antitermination protein NusG
VTDFESEQNQPEEINLEVESSDYAETDPAYIDDTNADDVSAEEQAMHVESDVEVAAESETAAAQDIHEAAVAEDEDPYAAFKKELREQPGKWFIIHSYAGYEKRVKQNIENRMLSIVGGDAIYQIEVPMEESIEIKNGQRKLVTKVRIPGYVLVRMDMNEDSWSLVRGTPAVTGFVGHSEYPSPLRPQEAFEMLKTLYVLPEEAAAKAAVKGGAKGKQKSIPVNVNYTLGESIMIKEGSFAGLPGTISEIKPESGKLIVLVSLFERETPVELAFDQVSALV